MNAYFLSVFTHEQKSFHSGSLPSDWKIAHIIPVHKKGPKHKKENYSQILSLTSIICKTPEEIVKSRVVSFWTEHQLLNPNQFGYLKGRSTVSQLLGCYNDWCLSRNSSKVSDVIFLDPGPFKSVRQTVAVSPMSACF